MVHKVVSRRETPRLAADVPPFLAISIMARPQIEANRSPLCVDRGATSELNWHRSLGQFFALQLVKPSTFAFAFLVRRIPRPLSWLVVCRSRGIALL